jgi:hypothetical protein
MPPMESDLLESDFDAAVNSHLYLFESRRDEQRIIRQAELIGLYVRVGPPDKSAGEDYDGDDW